MERSI